ncbi:MAG: LptF/LptG family permease, partial [Rhodospirillales bacterium]|nr:LptF/LptG family permease [Rhodospirillales bacterium]
MRISTTLSIYIGRNFIASFLVVLVVFLGLIFLFDTIELLRRASNQDNIGAGLILQMGLTKLPHMGQQAFPFAVLFGGMIAFWRLTRNSELVVARAAGVSAWQFLFPVLVVAFMLGIFKITALNPFASALLARYDRLNATYLKGSSNLLTVSPTGLWLRQATDKNHSVIRATNIKIIGNEIELEDITIFVYKGADNFSRRIDAKKGRLEDGFWHLK